MKINHTPDYKGLRASEYPGVAEQLDALWHAMNKGEIPKVEAFYDPIKAVKERFPKPGAT